MTGEAAPKSAGRPPSLWFGMWLRPRRTVRYWLDVDPTRHTILFASLSGIESGWSNASDRALGEIYDLPFLLVLAAGAGALQGVIGLYIAGALIGLTGRWLGGASNEAEPRAAFVWSLAPIVWLLPIWCVDIAMFGKSMFISDFPPFSGPLEVIAYFGFVALALVAAAWTIVIMSRAVAEAQGFGAWKGFANIALAALLFVAGAVLIGTLLIVTGVLPMPA